MTAEQETYLVDYPCDRHCQVEIDLTEFNPRFTLRQMRVAADAEHRRQHPAAAGSAAGA